MYIENHLLKGTFAGRSAKQLHCNKKSGLLEYPDMIVLHYTAGGNACLLYTSPSPRDA